MRLPLIISAASIALISASSLGAAPEEVVHPVLTAITTELEFTEGPIWDYSTQSLIFSDLRKNTEYRWSESSGLEIFRHPSNQANGHAFDPQGRLISCERGIHSLTRREADGTYTVLADSYEGIRFNETNDVVVRSDGNIYFTDPNYDHREGRNRQFVYRIDPEGNLSKAVEPSFNKPNGIALSPDGTTLYVNIGSDHLTLAWPLDAAGAVSGDSKRVADGIDRGLDGMAVHPDSGDLFLAAYWNNRRKPDEQGINVFSPRGKYKGMIPIPGTTTNCTFGPEGDILYVTSGGSVYKVDLGADYRGQRIGETTWDLPEKP